MAKIISIHSFRGGTGKSNTTANVAAVYARQGLRVGVVDTDIQSPGIHVLFGFDEDKIKFSLNDYLWGKCKLEQAAYDVTANVGSGVKGQIFLIPSSIKPGEIAKILREGYDTNLLSEGFRNLIQTLKLDLLLIDTHPGLNEETLLSIAISDTLAIVMRPDQQDYQGTAVTARVARQLSIPKMFLIVNKAPAKLDPTLVKAQVEKTYGAPVAAVMPHSEELASGGIFVSRYPEHSITALYKEIATALSAD